MGWPKKNADLRLYFERKGKSYLLVDTSARTPRGSYECIGELLIDNDPQRPMLCTTSCDPLYLYRNCRRVSWSDMPRIWRGALRRVIVGSPRKHRGLWRTHECSS